MKTETSRADLTFTNVNHYVTRNLYLRVASDAVYAPYTGQIGYLKFHLCGGAYDTNYPSEIKPVVPPVVIPPTVKSYNVTNVTE